mgnify:CR=1 FL=1
MSLWLISTELAPISWISAVGNTCKIGKNYLKYVCFYTYLESKMGAADFLYHIAYAGGFFYAKYKIYIYFVLMTTSSAI